MYAILDDEHNVIEVANITELAEQYKKDSRIVKQDTLSNGRFVSTVFLGIDHSFDYGPPLWFETMIFPSKGEWSELWMNRYTTYEEAINGHEHALKVAEKDTIEFDD